MQYYLDLLGRTASEEQTAEILQRVKELGAGKKALVTLEEFCGILDSCC